MLEQEVVDYISQAQKHGLSDFEIKQNLLNVGWGATVVEDSLIFAKAAENKSGSSPMPTKISDPSLVKWAQRTAFEHPVVQQAPPEKAPAAPAIEPAQPSIAINNQPISGNSGHPFYKKPLLWIIIALVLVLGAGSAYAYLGYFSATPAKVMSKYLSAPKAKTFNTIYSVSYTDNSAASSTGNISVAFSGNLSSDLSDLSNIKQQNNINASLTYDIASFSVNFKYLLLGQVIYFDIGQIPQLKAFLPDQNIQWVKVDLNELKKQQDQSESQIFNQLSLNPQVQTQLKDIWSKTNVLTTTNFFAKESLNGVPTYHLKEQFNNQAFAAALLSSIQTIAAQSTSTAAALTDSDKQLVTALINKIQVKELDLWIGQKDSEIYKFHLLVSAPTIKDFSNPVLADDSPGLSQARAEARNAKRIADVEQMSSALELYNNDFGGYPSAGANGQPQNLTPTYIGILPIAPVPLDGTCTNYYNTYWYTPQGTASVKKGVTVYPSYKLTFCLGGLTGGYQAGIGQLTPSGIQANIACPTTAAKCVNSSAPVDNSAAILAAVNQMTFAAQVQIDASYSGYGQPQTITAPATSKDILDLIKGMNGQMQATTSTPATEPVQSN